MTSLEILMRCGWDVADALEITKGRRRIMVEPTLPIADANELKYRGLNIPTEDWIGSFSDWNEVTQVLSGVHLTDEKKVEIPH